MSNEKKTRVEDPTTELEPGQYRVVDKTAETEGKSLKKHKVIMFEFHSKEDNRIYAGPVEIKRLSIGERVAYEGNLARLNSGLDALTGMSAMLLNRALLDIRFQLVSADDSPEWLKNLLVSDDITDLALLERLSEEVQTFNASF